MSCLKSLHQNVAEEKQVEKHYLTMSLVLFLLVHSVTKSEYIDLSKISSNYLSSLLQCKRKDQ